LLRAGPGRSGGSVLARSSPGSEFVKKSEQILLGRIAAERKVVRRIISGRSERTRRIISGRSERTTAFLGGARQSTDQHHSRRECNGNKK
jgi:hypothetical protein